MDEPRPRHPWLERLREERDRHLSRSRFVRVPFAVLGFTVVLIGLALLVLPGPGLLVIAVGLGMLALEFAWAERVLERTRLLTGGLLVRVQPGELPPPLHAAQGARRRRV